VSSRVNHLPDGGRRPRTRSCRANIDSPAVKLYERYGFETIAERGGATVMVTRLS
jgi:ribosomal protein S18 acetylase RimI-like enzyme